MSILDWLANLGRRSRIDIVARQLHRELNHVNDGAAADRLVTDAAVSDREPTLAECRAMVDVLSRLPPRQRAVLELRMKGMNPAQIAAELGLTREVTIRELGQAMYVAAKELPLVGDRT